MISTRTSLALSNASTAVAIPRATSPLTALRAAGRLMVMTATPSSTSVRTASSSAMAASLPGPRPFRFRPGRGPLGPEPASGWNLLGLEPDAAVEADDVGVHVVVLDQRPDQERELGRRAHALGEDDGRDQALLELLAGLAGAVDRRVDDPGADRVDPHPDRGQVAGGRPGRAGDG